jgi:hypothetical protein
VEIRDASKWSPYVRRYSRQEWGASGVQGYKEKSETILVSYILQESQPRHVTIQSFEIKEAKKNGRMEG